MKARLIYFQNQIQLLLFTGKILILSISEARDFLLTFSDPEHYTGPGTWDYADITLETYGGSTIAFVDEHTRLIVEDCIKFREIIDGVEVNYLTVNEFAAKHNKGSAIVRRMCQNGRIEGAILRGRAYLIPETSTYPDDARVGKRS